MNAARWRAVLEVAGLAGAAADGSARPLAARSPIDGAVLAHLPIAGAGDINEAIAAARAAFEQWRTVPAPRRGELVRRFAMRVRQHQQSLADLITLEAGKIPAEANGEVQEVVDICDFACGLSRQLQGLTLPSERPGHHLLERWQPLGPVAIITAFNFPMAVWAWNAALALVCGDSILWKPSEKTPLCAQALHRLLEATLAEFAEAPPGLSQLIVGAGAAGAQLAADARVALVSATGSTTMGRAVAQTVAARFGRSLLELGGNNAAIVTASADLSQALRAIVFAAAGTTGQRCTTLRRLYVQQACMQELTTRLLQSFSSIPVGNPFEAGMLVGPLIDAAAFEHMQAALRAARGGGAAVHGGERVAVAGCANGFYVRPALVQLTQPIPVLWQETFAPILYVLSFDKLNAAIAQQNAASHGLSSAIFTNDMREAELFLSACGSDCGIANVNCGTSGAEIGGAFGGEKDSGGGRESGSDSWKSYMRRQTQSVNYSGELPLAQGVQFG
jgi:aldehyde dehydrogenase (NAD+)